MDIQVLISSFYFIRIVYQCNWTKVLRNKCKSGYILKRGVLFHCMSLTFRKGVYFESYFELLWVVERKTIRIYGEPQRGYVTLQFVMITQFVIHYKLRWIATQFVIHRISNCVVRATRFVMYYKLRQNFIISNIK